MSNPIVRDMLEALKVQHINELMDDGRHYIVEVCRRITSENKKQLEAAEGEALRHADTLEKYANALDRADKAEQIIKEYDIKLNTAHEVVLIQEGELEAAEATIAAMIEGLELQDTEYATPESLKLTCQIVALAAKKHDPMKATIAEMKQTLSFDWDLLKTTQGNLRDCWKSIKELELDRGRRDAKIAVLTGVLAKLARDGQREYAQKMLKKADEAWVAVKPEDLVRATVS